MVYLVPDVRLERPVHIDRCGVDARADLDVAGVLRFGPDGVEVVDGGVVGVLRCGADWDGVGVVLRRVGAIAPALESVAAP